MSYFHRPICSGIQRVAVSTVLTEQPILCGVCNAMGVFRTHDGDCTSTMCEKCIAGHVSTQVEQRQDPLCCCGFVLPPGVIESLLVGNEDLLSSYVSMLKRRTSERCAPAHHRDFSEEQGYSIRDNRAERIRRQRRSISEEGGTGTLEDKVCPELSVIGKAFALQSAKIVMRDLKESGPSSDQMNKFIDEEVFPVILNLHNQGRKTAEDFKRISKEASDLKLALDTVKRALAQAISSRERGSLGHHRPVIDKIVGNGLTSDKTLRTQDSGWVRQIQRTYPEASTLKEIQQLAEALAKQLCLIL